MIETFRVTHLTPVNEEIKCLAIMSINVENIGGTGEVVALHHVGLYVTSDGKMQVASQVAEWPDDAQTAIEAAAFEAWMNHENIPPCEYPNYVVLP